MADPSRTVDQHWPSAGGDSSAACRPSRRVPGGGRHGLCQYPRACSGDARWCVVGISPNPAARRATALVVAMSPRLNESKPKADAHWSCRHYRHERCSGTVLVASIAHGVQGIKPCGCYCHIPQENRMDSFARWWLPRRDALASGDFDRLVEIIKADLPRPKDASNVDVGGQS